MKRINNWDFYLLLKHHHWVILPTFIFYYNKNEFLETGVYSPAWGLTFRWLTLMMGFQVQKDYE